MIFLNINKVKINTRQTKRKGNDPNLEILKTPTKKPKTMKDEEIITLLKDISKRMNEFSDQAIKTEQNMTTLSSNFTSFKESLEVSNKKVEDKFDAIENELGKIQDTVTNIAIKVTEEVKNSIVPFIQDEIAPKIKAEVKNEVLKAVDATWKLQLAEKKSGK